MRATGTINKAVRILSPSSCNFLGSKVLSHNVLSTHGSLFFSLGSLSFSLSSSCFSLLLCFKFFFGDLGVGTFLPFGIFSSCFCLLFCLALAVSSSSLSGTAFSLIMLAKVSSRKQQLDGARMESIPIDSLNSE